MSAWPRRPTAGWVPVPAEQLVSAGVHLRRALEGDVAPLVAAVNESLDHLRPWMSRLPSQLPRRIVPGSRAVRSGPPKIYEPALDLFIRDA
jgi:hypothetical protein